MFVNTSKVVLRNLFQNTGVLHRASQQCVHAQKLAQQRSIHGLSSGESLLPNRVYIPTFIQRRFAARKGTREKKSKKIAKKEVKKEEFVPYQIRMAKLKVSSIAKNVDEKGKPEAIDDVFGMRYFKTRPITLHDAIQFHRETNHPTVYNRPDLLIFTSVELDMKLEKKNRYLDNFTRILLLPHTFNYQPVKKVVAFCKTEDLQNIASEAGAELVGGLDLIKKIQAGAVSLHDYDHFVAHTDMLNDLVPIRGLLKRRFPNLKQGSLGTDLPHMIERFSYGIEFASTKDSLQLDYGLVEVPFGRLTMSTEELEANFKTILNDIESCRGRSSGAFITSCRITAPPSKEKFLVQIDNYITASRSGGKVAAPSAGQEEGEDEDENEQDDEEQLQKKAV